MSKFILGDGISGKIWKFYNPEFEIISPVITRPGSTIKVADSFNRSKMVWLHDCVEIRQLLVDLGWKNPEEFIKKSKIGYFENGVIKDKLNPELKSQLVSKKMAAWDKWKPEPSEVSISGDSPRLSLSSGKEDMTNFMNVVDVDHGQLLYRLSQKCPSTHGYVGVITDYNIGITNTPPNQDSGYVYEKYDQIISTIPAPVFWRAWKNGHPEMGDFHFNSLPITFVTMKKRPKEFDGDYEMIYYSGEEVPFTRISHLANKYCIEFTGEMPREVFEKMFPELAQGISDYWVLPQGRIKSQFTMPPANVIFSGRFAQWQHEITTEHVIQAAVKYAKEKNNEITTN